MNKPNITVTDLIAVDGTRLITDSRKVALAFGKQHKNVLRVIDEMRANNNPIIAEHSRLNFEPCIFEYRTGKGALRKASGYTMTQDGMTELAMSFTGDDARVCRIRFIAAFKEMAKHIDNAQQGLWKQMQELIARETASQVKASFGSHLMLARKKEIPPLRDERQMLEDAIQPSLLN